MSLRFNIGAAALALSAAAGAAAGEPATAPAAAGRLVLGESGLWRAFYAWKTPVLRKDGALKEEGRDGYGPGLVARTDPPPPGWREPDFADSAWSRAQFPRHGRSDYGFGGSGGPTLSALCLRGKFRVDDPAAVRGLALSLAYRGGVAVYLNGKELARQHLPKEGALAADALADDYPAEAFLRADGKCIMSHAVHDIGKVMSDAEGLARRIRELKDLAIKPADLRKGTNLLAVELHRAPYFGNGLEKEDLNHRSIWGTCGLVSLALRAEAGAEPNVSRPKGLQVWSTSVLRRSGPADWADPLEPSEPVSITACRNGRFTGKVTVACDRPLAGVRAEAGELKRKDGQAAIPASAIQVLYAVRDDAQLMRHRSGDGYWDSLLAAAPEKVEPVKRGDGTLLGAVQPVVLKVRVGAEAAPGDYAGKLSVSANGEKPVEVPVELRVLDWKLPDPADYVTHMGIVQSPDSVAIQYKVPLWSEEHWKLMEKSFELIGELGNKYLAVPLICRTNFGNEQTMVRWVQDGQGWKFDFAIFDRYLDLAQKHQKMDVVCLYLWDAYTGYVGWSKSEGKPPLVTRWDPQAQKAEGITAPRFESPEGKPAWGQLAKELGARLEKRGLAGATMLGISSEWWMPTKETAAAYKEFFPNAKWVANGHPDMRGGNASGIPIAYNTAVYVNLFPVPGQAGRGAKDGYYHGWQVKDDLFPRAGGPATRNPLYPSSHLAVHRITMEAAFFANFSGLGRTGADFWPVLGRESLSIKGNAKRSTTVTARFPGSCWDQLNMDTATENLLAAGPSGAMPTERFEQVREGVQDCEARICIEKALLDGKLPVELAKKCREVLDERQWRIRAGCNGNWNWYEGAGSAGLAEKLYSTAAEVAGKPGAKSP